MITSVGETFVTFAVPGADDESLTHPDKAQNVRIATTHTAIKIPAGLSFCGIEVFITKTSEIQLIAES
jgi:hypothetical protein